MIKELVAGAILFALFSTATAQVIFGQPSAIQGAVCLHRHDAIAIAQEDSKNGIEAALKLFATLRCTFASFEGTVTKVVYSIKDSKNDNRIIRVLEVVVNVPNGKEFTAYILTDAEIPNATGT